VVASWDVYVTLDPPPYPSQLEQEVEQLSYIFGSLTQLSTQGVHIDLKTQSLRRERLRSILRTSRPVNRVKRGLLDVGGLALHALFGVATSSELNRFKDAVTEIGARQDQIAHAHDNLATVVNQTRTYIARMAEEQKELHSHVRDMSLAIAKVKNGVNTNSVRITQIELTMELDRYLDVLDLAADNLVRQTSRYHRQRSELEMGHLSRNLLSESQLKGILAQASGRFQVISELEWYYHSLSVTPLWHLSNNLS